MGKYSAKMMGKEVGSADVYAEPHTMTGKKLPAKPLKNRFAMEKTVMDADLKDPVPSGVSYGRSGEPKTSGIKIRGTGAATKGVMARGPMG
jgi:hypothetical protein